MSLTDSPQRPERKSGKPILQSILPYTTVAVIIAALYVAWVFYSRYQSTHRAQEAIQARKDKAIQRSADQIFGSGEIRFSTFGVDSGVLKRGERTQLCYGVLNAATVKIEPALGEETKPSYHHCIEIAPAATTTYTITAEDGKGNSKSESITVRVN